jgi:hypothetical protein
MDTFFTVTYLMTWPGGGPPALLLTARDDLDVRTMAIARRELTALTASSVVADVTGCFVSARGVALLVETVARLLADGRWGSVGGLSRSVLRLLPLFDAQDLPLHPTLDEAVAALRRGRDAHSGG